MLKKKVINRMKFEITDVAQKNKNTCDKVKIFN